MENSADRGGCYPPRPKAYINKLNHANLGRCKSTSIMHLYRDV